MKPTLPADSLISLEARTSQVLVGPAGIWTPGAPGAATTTGRSDAADHPVADERMSRLHASLGLDHTGRLEVIDLGSRNGTFVDGRRTSRTALEAGTIVRTGDTSWVVAPSPGAPENGPITGTSGAVARLREELGAAAGSSAPVLLEGPTGSGKDEAAQELHRLRARPGPFIAVSGAAVPGALAVEALFGGTEAAGLFAQADTGTLLLDDLEALPAGAQAALVRVLEDGWITPTAGQPRRRVDVCVVACARASLDQAVLDGRFLPELLARFVGRRLRVPALVDRKEDLPLLLKALGRDPSSLHPDVLEALLLHSWPYGVRELVRMLEGWTGQNVDAVTLLHLPRALAERLHARRDGEEGPLETPADGLTIADDGSWFSRDGERVDLQRRHVLRRVLTRLADTSPSNPATLDDLLGAGWPGQQIGWEAACNRVYVAIATLRKLGLGSCLHTTDEGYHLSGAVRIWPGG